MSALRRYEILLPSQFNDGRPVPQDLVADTLHELEHGRGQTVEKTGASNEIGRFLRSDPIDAGLRGINRQFHAAGKCRCAGQQQQHYDAGLQRIRIHL